MYIPILKAKGAEIEALQHFDGSLFNTQVLPLLEVLNEKHASTLTKSSKKLPPHFLLDVKNPVLLKKLFNNEEIKQKAIEVINLNYHKIDKNKNLNGLYLRIPALFDNFSELQTLQDKDKINLIVDYDSVLPDSIPAHQIILTEVPKLKRLFVDGQSKKMIWKSITVAGSSFPQSMAGVPQGPSFHDRYEYSVLYKNLKLQFPFIQFGDYTVSHPELFESSEPIYKMAAKMKYTTENGFYIIKGRDVFQGSFKSSPTATELEGLPVGFNQFPFLAQLLVKSEYFSGPNTSWGDLKIYEKATTPNVKPGNFVNWVSYWTNHHIGLVINQLAN